MFTPWTQSIHAPPPPPSSAACHIPLVPNSLARHPHTWVKDEVRAWLEWCTEEFAIEPICPDKFDMNGKALGLLTRKDFLDRDPTSGDILFNALQRLISKHDMPLSCSFPPYSVGLQGNPVAYTQRHHQSPCVPNVSGDNRQNGIILLAGGNTQPTSSNVRTTSSFIPILPGPITSHPPMSSSQSEHSTVTTCVPESVLSPAPTNTDTDSAVSDADSTHDVDRDVKYKDSQEHTGDFLADSTAPQANGTSEQMEVAVHGIKKNEGDCRLLWEFIHQLLIDAKYSEYVSWENRDELVFRIVNPTGLAELWGLQKNRTNMTYEKLSRALRYYYKMNIIKKVQGKRLTYKFLQHPRNIRKGQRGARPHSAKANSGLYPKTPSVKHELQTEARSPPIRDGRVGVHSVGRPHDQYDQLCELQLIDGHLQPPVDSGVRHYNESMDRLTPSLKREFVIQDEPEDLSMKTLSRVLNTEPPVGRMRDENLVDILAHMKQEQAS